jgi:putative membrane protein
MNTHGVAGVAAVLLAFSVWGCKAKEETSTTRTTSAPTATEVQRQTEKPMTPQKTALTTEDKDFLTKQAQERMEEVANGKEVQRKAASADVKALGQRMVNENAKALDELKMIAEKKGLALPTELDKERQAEVDKLAKLSGKKLDKQYASEMVDEREDDVKDLRDASQKLYDPDLKSWAAANVPIFEKELATAKDIKAKTKNE